MNALRHHVLIHRRWAAALIALALLAKLLVPAGYMPSVASGRITVELCSGFGVQKVEMAIPGVADHQQPQGEHGKADSPCTFTGLTAPSLAAADPLILAIGLAFILAIAFRRTTIVLPHLSAHLRPPLRGPPAIA